MGPGGTCTCGSVGATGTRPSWSQKDKNMTKEKFIQFMDEMPMRGIPECDIVVSQNGKIVFEKAVGRDDPKRNLEYVCSISKVTTCVAALRLLEEGKIHLDDPVEKFLPAYKYLTVKENGVIRPAKTQMTIRHLFTMTGGLNYNLNTAPILRAQAKPGASTIDIVNSFVEGPLEFDPGERFLYSLGHDVLAAVVEVVSGEKFSSFVKKNIFEPLGMTDSTYKMTDEVRARMMRQYRYSNATLSSTEIPLENKYVLSPDYESGGAGLITSAADQIKLFTALSLGGTNLDGYRLLNEETVKMCEIPQLSDKQMQGYYQNRLFGYSWGLCGRVHKNPFASCSPSSAGEFGWDGATGSYGLADRKQGLAFYFGLHIYGCSLGIYQLHENIRNNVYHTFIGE